MKINEIVVTSVIIIALLSGISSFAGMKAWPTVKTHTSYVSPRGDATRMLTTGIYRRYLPVSTLLLCKPMISA